MRSSVVDTHRPPSHNSRNAQQRVPDPRFFQNQAAHQSVPPATPVVKERRWRLAPLEGWSPLLFLAIALYCVVSSIISAQWVSHSSLLFWSPVLGILLGLIIAKVPRLPQTMLHLASCLAGYWFAVWITCYLGFHVPWTGLFGGMKATLMSGLGASSSASSSDIVFFFYLSFLCFFLGYFGCWLVYRAHLPWLVALVYCSIILVNLNYVKQDSAYLVVILAGALLLLIARVQLTTQLVQWTRDGLYTDRAWRRMITWRCMQIACVLALLAVVLCNVIPVPGQPASGKKAWDSVNNAVNNIANGHVSLQNPSSLLQPYQPPANFFGNQMTISGRVTLPTGEVLTYTTSGGPRYLEGFTYNNFDGHTWSTTLTSSDERSYGANDLLPTDAAQYSPDLLHTTVTVAQPPLGTKNYIFAPHQPYVFNVATTTYNDGTTGAWVQQSPLLKGETYQVTSEEPLRDARRLQEVPLPGDDQNTWRADPNYGQLALFYLQTPKDLSPKVLQTMQSWTKGTHDTYSALKAIESHLNDSTVFTYSVDNDPVPSNIDVADWLLQTRKGYCTYYATEMAVMGRLLGIPTRVVNGFNQGTFDRQRNLWSVSGSDAHSWVQAYFPLLGWIDFDPTPGYAFDVAPGKQPVVPIGTVRPGQNQPGKTQPKKKQPTAVPTQAPGVVSQGAPHQATATVNSSMLWITLVVTLLLLMLAGFVWGVRRWWRNLFAQASLVSEKFWRLCYLAHLAGLGPKSWQTPYEYGEMLSRHFPQHTRSLWHLTNMFVRERWAAPQQAPREEEARSISGFWPSLQSALLQRLVRKK